MRDDNVIEHNAPLNDKQNRTYVWIMYVLFALAVVTGTLSAVIGVILAYVKRNDMYGTIYYDHTRYLIKTFWGGLAAYAVGVLTLPIVIGMVILFAAFIWFVYRLVAGMVKLNDGKTIALDGWL